MKKIILFSRLISPLFLPLFTACTTPKAIVPQTHASLDTNRDFSRYQATGERWMISSQGVLSTQAGVEMLEAGGNLYDAFTAISFAIGVERPQSTGIGGGGFLLFYNAREKKTYAFDFREKAPALADSRIFLKADGTVDGGRSVTGALAIATPGFVAGVLEIHKKFGQLPLAKVLAPAIRMAREGFPVYPALFRAMTVEKENLAKFAASKKIFLNANGEPWPVGHLLKQIDLARTMGEIAKRGPKAFYEGPIAGKIVDAIKKEKGLITLNDLKNYQPVWRTPVHGTYHQYNVYSQPPPSSGGVHVIEILNMVENEKLNANDPQDPANVHEVASAMQRAFADRAEFMGDPDFVKVPVEMLTSKDYAGKRRAQISRDKALSADGAAKDRGESPETTHFSLMDSEGNALASTQTINGYFGSAIVAGGTGVMLNNEMDDFAAIVGGSNIFGAVGGKNNLVEGNKRPLSSMSPTIVMDQGRPKLALGSPSGTKIITCVAQTLLNYLEFQKPLWESLTLTRYHHQWHPDQLQVEAPGFPAPTEAALKKMGYDVVEKDLGCRIEAIAWENGLLRGASDPREEGSSVGR